jgi:hypothetical protein
MFRRSACSFHGNFQVEHAFQFWDHSPQVLDYQDFLTIECQIKGICCTLIKFTVLM